MSLAKNDLEQLGTFISSLRSYNDNFQSQWSRLDSHFGSLREVWEDANVTKFTESVGWSDVERQMQNYISTSEQYVDFLKRLYDRLESYLNV